MANIHTHTQEEVKLLPIGVWSSEVLLLLLRQQLSSSCEQCHGASYASDELGWFVISTSAAGFSVSANCFVASPLDVDETV